MTQRRNAGQPFEERLYGMFMEIFRLTGTMPGTQAQERIRNICTEIRSEFLKAGGGKEAISTVLTSMKPVVKTLEDKIDNLKEELDALTERLEEKEQK